MPEKTKISHGVQKTLLGLDATRNSNPSKSPDNTAFIGRYTPSEGASLTKSLYVPQLGTNGLNPMAASIISCLKPRHAEIGKKRLNTEKMAALAPEIEQAKILVSSSIMSPNDLQDGEFTFSFDNVPAIQNDPDLLTAVSKLYSDYFNGVLELGIKSYDWIGDIQYRSGAKPILILPPAIQESIKNRTEQDVEKNKFFNVRPGMSDFEIYQESHKNLDYLYSKRVMTWKDVLSQKEDKKIVSDMVPSMESFGVPVPNEYRSQEWLSNHKPVDQMPGYVTGLETLVVNMKTKLEEGDVLKVSENPEILRFNTVHTKNTKADISRNLNSVYGGNQPTFVEEPVVSLTDIPKDITHKGHPTLIELPVESVIPIIVPGTPSEHLGYFVLLDENGQPLTAEKSGLDMEDGDCTPGSANSAYSTLFGNGKFSSMKFFGSSAVEHNASKMVMSQLVDIYLRSRMEGIFGRNDLELSRFNSINTTLFYRLLEQKHTTMVFVPTDLLHYFAFAYRPEGDGACKLDEISFLLSLRTNFMIANVMAAARNAVEHRQIKFTPSDQETNIEGFMDAVTNIFNAKMQSNLSLDPSEIMGDMYNNSLTVVPTKIPGMIDSLEIDAERSSGGSVPADDKLLEDLTNLYVSGLDVPPASLNQLSEPEYAKSLVVNNLFFAKKIARYQRIWCGQISSFIRYYVSYDPIFKNALIKTLNAHGKHHAKEKLTEKVQEFVTNNPNKYSSLNSLVEAIIRNVTVKLPTPNIVVDQAQFNEIRDFVSATNEVADTYYPDDLVGDDEAAQAGLRIVKAKWKRDQFIRFKNEVGSFTMMDLNELDDVGDGGDIVKFIQTMQNVNSHIQRHNAAVSNFANSEMPSGSDMSGGGEGGGGFGGDDFGGDFGGDDMGGGDDFDMGSSEDEGGSDMDMSMPDEGEPEE